MHPWTDINTDGWIYAGIPVGQSLANLHLLGTLITDRLRLRGCLEIGTWRGALAVHLALHFAPLCTITADIEDKRTARAQALHQRLGISFRRVDCHNLGQLQELFDEVPRPALVFVDGGNKQLEFALAVPLLRSGDLIGVHDVGTEFHVEVASPLIDEYGLRLAHDPVMVTELVEQTHAMYWDVP